MLATPEVLAAFVLVDVSYASNAFAFVVDLVAKRMLIDRSALGLPAASVRVGEEPNEGTEARFTAAGLRIRISRAARDDGFSLLVRSRDLSIAAELVAQPAPPPLVLIAPVAGGTLNVTQKSACLAARGSIRVGGRTYELDGGFGGFDYTTGLLAHRTAWRWAFATGRASDGRIVGLNLVEGFNEEGAGSENVVWVDGSVIPLARTHFTYERHATTRPWMISSEDGAVALTFRPVGEHREDRNLIVARSHFAQVAGTFTGTVNAGGTVIRVADLPGVAEDQDVTW